MAVAIDGKVALTSVFAGTVKPMKKLYSLQNLWIQWGHQYDYQIEIITMNIEHLQLYLLIIWRVS